MSIDEEILQDEQDIRRGTTNVVIGNEVMTELYPYEDPIGKTIRIGDACYLSRKNAIAAARRAAYAAHGRVMLAGLTAAVFRVMPEVRP